MTDEELDRLARQDVAVRFTPPAPGSDPYLRLLERAMTMSTIDLAPAEARPLKSHRRSLRWTAVAVGAAAAVIAAGAVLPRTPAEPVHPESAAAAMRLAADAVTEVKSLRIRGDSVSVPAARFGLGPEHPDPKGSWSLTEISGTDSRVTTWAYATARPEGYQETRIGDELYQTDEHGNVTKDSYSRPRDPNQESRDAAVVPFSPAAGHVIAAAAGDRTLRELGDEKLAGLNTRHFQISLVERSMATEPVPAILQLPRAELTRFGLQNIDGLGNVTLDFWVSDDHLIRRVSSRWSAGPDAVTTLDFFDFNEPITIRAPKLTK
jgi:hypothetical protein